MLMIGPGSFGGTPGSGSAPTRLGGGCSSPSPPAPMARLALIIAVVFVIALETTAHEPSAVRQHPGHSPAAGNTLHMVHNVGHSGHTPHPGHAPQHPWAAHDAHPGHSKQKLESGECMRPVVKHGVKVELGQCHDGAGQRASYAGFPDGFAEFDCEMHLAHAVEPSCTAECGPGEFLSADASGAMCQPCPPGTFSIGGGHVLDHWAHMPPQLTTRCFRFDLDAFTHGSMQNAFYWRENWGDCGHWNSNGTFVGSGNNRGLDYVESYMILHLRFVKPGNIWFTFEVDAEQYADGLVFRMDDENLPLDDLGGVLASQSPRRTVRFDVEPGWHIFKWVFIKDLSSEDGEDIAKIFEIGYNGTEYALDTCQPCRAGGTSEAGSDRCGICPLNHHWATLVGACIPCPAGYYALAGMGHCQHRAACTGDDWEVTYTPCVGGKRTRTYNWREPQLCLAEGGVTLPPKEDGVECLPCPPGSYKVDSQCRDCPKGSYSRVEGASECAMCPAGHEAPMGRELAFGGGWPQAAKTANDGGTRGWRISQLGYADVGGAGPGEAWVEFEADFDPESSRRGVTVQYEMACGGGDKLSITSGGGAQTLPCGDGKLTHSLVPPPLANSVRVTFAGTGHDLGVPSPRLHAVRLAGLKTGGAADCVLCKRGMHAAGAGQSTCTRCSAGHTSSASMRTCVPCPSGTFSPVAGFAEGCIPCGNNTYSSVASAHCSADCVYRGSNDVQGAGGDYDLKPLGTAGMVGPFFVDVIEAGSAVPLKHSVAFSLCSDLQTRCGVADQTNACSVPVMTSADGAAEGASSFAAAGFSVGRVMNFYPLGGEMDDTFQQGVTVEYKHGDQCGHGGLTWSIQIHIHCDVSAGLGAPVATHADNCIYHFNWFTQHGCPVCTTASYTMLGTPCVGGYHDVTYHKEGRCFGGTVKPEDRKNANCHEQLQDVMPAWAVFIVVSGCLGIVGGISMLAYQFLKYRKLYSRYQQLGGMPVTGAPGGAKGAEMDTFEFADDEDI